MPKPIRFRAYENPDSASARVASEIALIIRERAALGRTAVFGLATGRSLLPFYQELIYLHREEGLSFENAVTFNLDEYHGLPDDHPQSFRQYMQRNFFDHVDIPPANVNFLSGSVPDFEIVAHCNRYEEHIQQAGGIDYQILGIGRNGRICVSDPGGKPYARTRRVAIDIDTRQMAVDAFGCIGEVPTHAVTMGLGTILEARRIAVLAWGPTKARIVRRVIEGRVDRKMSATVLRNHPTARFYLDLPAASLLGAPPKS